jgi:hypothetical protein
MRRDRLHVRDDNPVELRRDRRDLLDFEAAHRERVGELVHRHVAEVHELAQAT